MLDNIFTNHWMGEKLTFNISKLLVSKKKNQTFKLKCYYKNIALKKMWTHQQIFYRWWRFIETKLMIYINTFLTIVCLFSPFLGKILKFPFYKFQQICNFISLNLNFCQMFAAGWNFMMIFLFHVKVNANIQTLKLAASDFYGGIDE